MRTPFALAAALLLASHAAAAPPNTCSDPYWKDTLRCVLFPNEVPQPNLDSVPNGPGAFTRVFLEDDEVRCTDGTRPLIYVDKAICTNPNGCGNGIRRGDPITSNRWIFSMTGGDSCFGERCAFYYAQPDERAFMGSSSKGATKDMEGILDPDPARNPVFATYNRVRVEKCSFDRYIGRSQQEGIEAALPNGQTVRFNAYYHGFLIMQEALRTLEKGLRYPTWRGATTASGGTPRRRACCGSGANRVEEELPPLADAEQVLFIGHSNACHGLYHNIDHLTALLEAMPGFDGDVRALFDENFQPGIENEAAFAATPPANSDLYSGIWSGTSSARGETFSYDGAVHHTTDHVDQEYAAHGMMPDASCLDAHTADGTTWKCNERVHVLANHISTPFMVRQDFTDPNRDHLDAPNGYWVRWGDEARYSYCPAGEACDPRMNAAEFRIRVAKQIETLLAGVWSRSELARGVDSTIGPLPTVFAWMPECGQHEGSYGEPFYRSVISTGDSSFSMRQWLEEFMNAPPTGVRRYQIDGAKDSAGRTMHTSQCH